MWIISNISISVDEVFSLEMHVVEHSTVTPYSIDPISDTARLIFQWICYSVLGEVIAVFGITTNVINVICFVKQGFKDTVNISLLGSVYVCDVFI